MSELYKNYQFRMDSHSDKCFLEQLHESDLFDIDLLNKLIGSIIIHTKDIYTTNKSLNYKKINTLQWQMFDVCIHSYCEISCHFDTNDGWEIKNLPSNYWVHTDRLRKVIELFARGNYRSIEGYEKYLSKLMNTSNNNSRKLKILRPNQTNTTKPKQNIISELHKNYQFGMNIHSDKCFLEQLHESDLFDIDLLNKLIQSITIYTKEIYTNNIPLNYEKINTLHWQMFDVCIQTYHEISSHFDTNEGKEIKNLPLNHWIYTERLRIVIEFFANGDYESIEDFEDDLGKLM